MNISGQWEEPTTAPRYTILYLSASHTMEEVLLGSNACEKSSIHKASSTGTGVIGQERREEAPTGHQGGTLPLQLDLTKQARNLHTVYLNMKEKSSAMSGTLHLR